MTDGMLMKEYLADNDLRRYAALMLDEAHERTIHTGVLFGLLKGLCRRRPDLKIIVTSLIAQYSQFLVERFLWKSFMSKNLKVIISKPRLLLLCRYI